MPSLSRAADDSGLTLDEGHDLLGDLVHRGGLVERSGAGGLLRLRRISAAWRASICTMLPAAPRTSPDLIIGAAPL